MKGKVKAKKKKKDLNQSEEAAYSQNISENKLPYFCSLLKSTEAESELIKAFFKYAFILKACEV